MKNLVFMAVVLCLALTCQAGEIQRNSPTIVGYTNTTSSLTLTNAGVGTNISIISTNNQGSLFSIYHTFQNYYTASGTNLCTNSVDSTLDPSLTQWVNETNFVNTVSGANEYSVIGSRVAFRVRTTMLGTNSTTANVWFYMGK